MTALVSQTTKPRPKSYFGRQIWGHPLYKWQDKNLLPDIRKLFQLRLKYMTLNFREAEELSTNQQSAIPVVLESLPRPKPDPEQDAK